MNPTHNALYISRCGRKQIFVTRNTKFRNHHLSVLSNMKWKVVTKTGGISFWTDRGIKDKFKNFELLMIK
jgi:hypothetical protein